MDEPLSASVGRWPLAAAVALALGSVVFIGGVRLAGGVAPTADAPAVASRDLRFLDGLDGSIAVVDAADGRLVDRIVGENGFVRGTLRGLARERKRQGLGSEPPFRLVARADGRLTLLDEATGRRVDLESFGPVNAGQFARFLNAHAAAPAAPRS